MSIFKKFAAPLLAIALVAVMGVSLLTNTRTAYAANTITAMTLGLGPGASTTAIIPAWSGGSAIGFTFLAADTETWTAATTIILTAPATSTWVTPTAASCVITVVASGQLQPGGTCSAAAVNNVVTITPAGLVAAAATLTYAGASKVTVSLAVKTPNGTASGGTIAVSYGAAITGSIAAGTYGTLGEGKNFLLGWSTSTTAPSAVPITAYSAASSVADANGAGGALCAFAATTTPGTATVGLPVTFTVSLGVVSTGTGKSALAVTGTTGSVCTNYRGGGGVASTDTAIVSNSLTNIVDTLAVTLTAPAGGTAAKLIITQPTNSAVTPSVTGVTPGYISPTQQTNFAVQVQDSVGLGVNGQVLLVTVDKGILVAGFNATCGTAKAVTGTSVSQAQSSGGSAVAGSVSLTYCGNASDAAGKATITVSNITTTMANASSTISTSGRPAKVEATYANGVITAKVTDSNGNNVADGTQVQFTISSTAGAVSNACTTTSNGGASSAVSLNSGSGTVIVTASWNESGALAAGCVAAAAVAQGGNAGAVGSIGTTLNGATGVSSTVNIGSVVTPPATVAASGPGTFASAPVYSASKLAQAVFNGGTVVQLETAITATGTGAWAQDSKGVFALYIVNGGFVNDAFKAAFPTGFAGVTAVTVVGK